MPDGRPDLSGTYDTATLTPLVRPKELGDTLFLTEEEAAEIAQKMALKRELDNQVTDPDRRNQDTRRRLQWPECRLRPLTEAKQ